MGLSGVVRVGRGDLYPVIQLLDMYESYIPNLSPLVCIEPFEKFSVGGWVDNTVNIVFCFGPRLGLKTEVLAQAEQNWVLTLLAIVTVLP